MDTRQSVRGMGNTTAWIVSDDASKPGVAAGATASHVHRAGHVAEGGESGVHIKRPDESPLGGYPSHHEGGEAEAPDGDTEQAFDDDDEEIDEETEPVVRDDATYDWKQIAPHDLAYLGVNSERTDDRRAKGTRMDPMHSESDRRRGRGGGRGGGKREGATDITLPNFKEGDEDNEWRRIESAMRMDTSDERSLDAFMAAFTWYGYEGDTNRCSIMSGAISKLSRHERIEFYTTVLPAIKQHVLDMLTQPFDPDLNPHRVYAVSRRLVRLETPRGSPPMAGRSLRLNRTVICRMIACGFFSLYSPEHTGGNDVLTRSHRQSRLNFVHVLAEARRYDNALQKIRCILSYFSGVRSLSSFIMKEHVIFHRARLVPEKGNIIEDIRSTHANTKLCHMEWFDEGRIEDEPAESIHTDFANAYIGGGVLTHGCVQEEIMFITHPECLVSMLFMDRMAHDEAIHIEGALRFAKYKGYGKSFQFVGPSDEFSAGHIRNTKIISAIDALPFKEYTHRNKLERHGRLPFRAQLNPLIINRELTKATAGFALSPEADKRTIVSTGRWGCGDFNGSVPIKVMIQWIAATVAGIKTIRFLSMGDEKRLKDALGHVKKNMTVGDALCLLMRAHVRPYREDNGMVITHFVDTLQGYNPPLASDPHDPIGLLSSEYHSIDKMHRQCDRFILRSMDKHRQRRVHNAESHSE